MMEKYGDNIARYNDGKLQYIESQLDCGPVMWMREGEMDTNNGSTASIGSWPAGEIETLDKCDYIPEN